MARSIISLLVLSILAVFCCREVAAQTSLSSKGVDLKFTVLKTSNQNLTLESVINNKDGFKKPHEYLERTHPNAFYWIKIDLIPELENLKKESTWILTPEHFDYGILYQIEKGSVHETKFGWFENSPNEGSILYSQGIPFKSSGLIENKYIYLKVRSVVDLEKIGEWKISYRSQFKDDLAKNFYNETDLKLIIPSLLFAGMCIIMFLMMLMFFVYTKRLEFLFYCIYVLCLFIYLGPYVSKLYVVLFSSFDLTSYILFQQMQMLINLSYVLFVMYYLNTKKLYPRLHTVIKKVAWMLLVVIILDVLFLSSKYFLGHIYLLHFQRLFMSVFGLSAMVYLLVKRKDHLACFIVAGSFCYMIGALGLLFSGNGYFMIAGSSLDILIFATGLTYKIQTEFTERLQFQSEAHINKTKALRAQINPHFIFNSLNSIQNLITKNDKKSALRYLSRFSSLTRNVLESSIETTILLKDEIKMLNAYLELESLRFENAFDYSIMVDESIETEITEFPSMIVQPFVENAILHGLLPKQGNEKVLTLSFKDNGDFVLCEIEDNGIGREAAQKKSVPQDRKSRGMEITLQRFKTLMGDGYEDMIQIVDKKDGCQNAVGTKISIKIPI
ncbi:histidine kinase [uncultured Allomuricauda sp.]|uniref:sensor histidine kinase n=1 Tax=Flagellimonas sp. W118 TaxID=3410791 RepID=UPI00262E7B6C|nr:histidine kinase [uncultured Allomuricauda sp.]